MTWRPTNFRTPRTGDRKLRVLFRNGEESKHSYSAKQLRWSDTGSDFDITHVRLSAD
jgi:hypothetical protein